MVYKVKDDLYERDSIIIKYSIPLKRIEEDIKKHYGLMIEDIKAIVIGKYGTWFYEEYESNFNSNYYHTEYIILMRD